MSDLLTITTVQRRRRYSEYCPYRNSCSDRCMASLFSMHLDSERKERRCSTEDYDECPLFLSRVLRDRQF